MKNAGRREGSVLAITILLVLIIGLLAMALMDRTLGSSARAGWSRDHLALRLVAESAAEELFAAAGRAANDERSPVFKRLRTLVPDEGEVPAETPVEGLELAAVRAELPAHERAMGATIELAPQVMLREIAPVSNDASETCGILRITVSATANRRFFRMTEKVAIDREFRVARTTIHHPLQLDALVVRKLPKKQDGGQQGGGQDGQDGPGGQQGADGQDGPGGQQGADGQDGPGGQQGADGQDGQQDGAQGAQGQKQPHSYWAEHEQGARTLKKIAGEDGASLKPSPETWAQEIGEALDFLKPQNAMERAHFVTRRPQQLRWAMLGQLKRGKPVYGLYVSMGRRPLRLTFDRFQGQAVIVARGPVQVGDIKVVDPKRDRLTIASAKRIIVVGAQVGAHLISFAGKRAGVNFAVKTRVNGSVFSRKLPKGRKISQEDYDASEIAGVEGEDYTGNRDAAPPPGDTTELKNYTAMFSPHPVRVNHALD